MYLQLEGRDYQYHPPTQSPINPPYKEACQLRRTDKLSKPTTASDNNSRDNKPSDTTTTTSDHDSSKVVQTSDSNSTEDTSDLTDKVKSMSVS